MIEKLNLHRYYQININSLILSEFDEILFDS